VALVASLGLLHSQILSLEVVPFKGGRSHPGGVNVAVADGSVRFVTDQINATTWQNLASINGREAASFDQ
jgi:prepilin-type processing-associated H-X9-DG protein